MDLDIMESVQQQIMGNCLCVLGDAMAMPISSMIKHFRGEFEAHMERRRTEAGLGVGGALSGEAAHEDRAGAYAQA
jgi:NADH-quinone oxidoreductase subunit F